MGSAARPSPEQLLRLAQDGDGEALGRLLELYRNYLRLLARLQIDHRLGGKADASDVVQETALKAHRVFHEFRGTTEKELLAWLRQVLSSKIANLVRRFYGTQSRDIRLERRLDEEIDRSSHMAGALLCGGSSPSQRASRREQAVILADALEELPPHYREVIVLRHLKEFTFPEVARQMGRSVGSTKQLWVRALGALRHSLGGPTDVSV